MPHRMVWYDAPHDENLPVLQELPEGIQEDQFMARWHPNRREARGRINDAYKTYVYCRRCGGWIEGKYYTSRVNTLNSRQLAGRQGTEYYCPRCGEQVDFEGIMS